MPTAVRSHAKINLGLGIGAPRADGFHALTTVYQTLELHDVVTVTARAAAKTAIRLTSNDERVPLDGRNTAWKMVELALEELRVTADVKVHIDKRLPIQGGLGAGSANAVAALVGLEEELGISDGVRRFPGLNHPSDEDLLLGTPTSHPSDESLSLGTPTSPSLRSGFAQDDSISKRDNRIRHQDDNAVSLARRLWIAGQVGSDVPLFLIGGTVLGVDRGQEVYPLPDIEPVWCVVATPDVGVSTPQAFRDWDALCVAEGLTAEGSTAKLSELSRAYASAFSGGIPRGRHGSGSSGVFPDGEDLAGPKESALVRTGISSWIQNDFERVVFPQHPSLAEIKRILAASDTPEEAVHASLSGSGSALYGLYRTRGDAEAAQVRLEQAGVRNQLTRTLPRSSYWEGMLL
jgi:4-diphosphocytidyl-2-C-methyl-D-erythritol kinase